MNYRYRHKHGEAAFWLTAIAAMAISNPAVQEHYSLCLFNYFGIDHCWGCRMGHAIGWIFRANIGASWQSHPLAIPALATLCYRIYTLLKEDITIIKPRKIAQR